MTTSQAQQQQQLLAQIANNQAKSNAAYGGLLGGNQPSMGINNPFVPSIPQYYPLPAALVPKGRVTITIDEVSNGHIIQIGSLTRLAPFSENLMEHIGAAYTQAKMEENDAK